MTGSWPVALADGPLRLRPLRIKDKRAWQELRRANASWLSPWDATSPYPSPLGDSSFRHYVKALNSEARRGTMLPFAIEFDGALAGQITLSSIARGSLWSGVIGYWLSQSLAGKGITPTAVAMVTDYAFDELSLHRVEINVRPENAPSLRVVEKLGFRDEGVRRRYIHIGGAWADHRSFALTREDLPAGLLAKWRLASANTGDTPPRMQP